MHSFLNLSLENFSKKSVCKVLMGTLPKLWELMQPMCWNVSMETHTYKLDFTYDLTIETFTLFTSVSVSILMQPCIFILFSEIKGKFLWINVFLMDKYLTCISEASPIFQPFYLLVWECRYCCNHFSVVPITLPCLIHASSI